MEIKTNCYYYEAITETHCETHMSYNGNEEYIPVEVLVGEVCSFKKEYEFDCDNCEKFKMIINLRG